MQFFQAGPQVSIYLSGSEGRRRKNVRQHQSEAVEMMVYGGGETVSGTVEVSVPSRKKVEYRGMKLEFIGQVEIYGSGSSSPFLMAARVLESSPGVLASGRTYPFEFSNSKIFDSYAGLNVRLRYFLKVTMERPYASDYVKELDIAVENSQSPQIEDHLSIHKSPKPIKLEVGIEDCLHIEFEYDRDKYHLEDVIMGKIYFLLVRIKIKHMELAVVRRESCGLPGGTTSNDSENITKYELMDGAPIKGECVPIRLFLAPLAVTPTYRSIANIFTVKYFLNLVLIDEEDRRYFKQQEVTLWRKEKEDEVEEPDVRQSRVAGLKTL